MRPTVFILVLAIVVTTVEAQGKKSKPSALDKIFRSMFQPRKPIATPVKRKRSRSKKSSKESTMKPRQKEEESEKTLKVDMEWMAKYVELEQQWDYPIPEDDYIWRENGGFVVSPIVIKHYEDMAKTPKRNVTPVANGAVMP